MLFMKINIKKFASRKFIVTLLADLLGVCIILSNVGGKVGLIAAITSIVLTSVVYIVNEASIDKEGVKLTTITEEIIKDIEALKPLINDFKELEKKNK